jgi:TonB family protein
VSDLHSDIIKYRKGELSPKEMHALEKKALNDPFLADALEGSENISPENLTRDVEELNQKIFKQKKTVLFTPLRIAAGVILIAASAVVFYQLTREKKTIALKNEKPSARPTSKQNPAAGPKQESNKQEEKIEAKKREEPPKTLGTSREKAKPAESKPQESEVKPDVVVKSETAKPTGEAQPSIADAQTFAAPQKKAEEAETSKEVAPLSIAMEPAQHVAQDQDEKKQAVSVRSRKFAAKSEVASSAGVTRTDRGPSKSISGKVVSAEDGAPLPGVNVMVEGTTDGTVTDATGNFTLKTTRENQQLSFSFIGLQTKEVNIEGKDKVDVELKTDVSQLSEIVVTGYGMPSDDDAEPVIHLANPEGGRKVYNKYLDANVRFPEEALKNNIKGKVRVEFSVLPDGSLADYKVVKSLGHGCDEEVIRLIKEGPKWSPTTKNGQPIESKARVGVKFDPAKAGR